MEPASPSIADWPEPTGVLFISYLRGAHRAVLREALASATHLLRTLRPRLPLDLLANKAAHDTLEKMSTRRAGLPWDSRRYLTLDVRLKGMSRTFAADDVRNAYLHKLSGLLSTRFNRTLYLDCDVMVVSPNFASDLLSRALHVADVAMPLDPGRAAHLVPGEREGEGPAAPWVAPTIGPPMLCSAVLAYRQNAATDELFLGAARRLLARRHPGVRQGDQEMIWFQWVSGEGAHAAALRVIALPEETYCPLERRQKPLLPNWQQSTWRTSWRRGVYPCAAVHGHAYAGLV